MKKIDKEKLKEALKKKFSKVLSENEKHYRMPPHKRYEVDTSAPEAEVIARAMVIMEMEKDARGQSTDPFGYEKRATAIIRRDDHGGWTMQTVPTRSVFGHTKVEVDGHEWNEFLSNLSKYVKDNQAWFDDDEEGSGLRKMKYDDRKDAKAEFEKWRQNRNKGLGENLRPDGIPEGGLSESSPQSTAQWIPIDQALNVLSNRAQVLVHWEGGQINVDMLWRALKRMDAEEGSRYHAGGNRITHVAPLPEVPTFTGKEQQ